MILNNIIYFHCSLVGMRCHKESIVECDLSITEKWLRITRKYSMLNQCVCGVQVSVFDCNGVIISSYNRRMRRCPIVPGSKTHIFL